MPPGASGRSQFPELRQNPLVGGKGALGGRTDGRPQCKTTSAHHTPAAVLASSRAAPLLHVNTFTDFTFGTRSMISYLVIFLNVNLGIP